MNGIFGLLCGRIICAGKCAQRENFKEAFIINKPLDAKHPIVDCVGLVLLLGTRVVSIVSAG